MERGRPRQFDEAQALEAAMQVFWRDGYRGASIAELTSAMGINKPSLYSSFGTKEALYLKALEHYGASRAQCQIVALETNANIRDALSAFLKLSVASSCDKSTPAGCYVVNALSDCGTGATPAAVVEGTRHAFGLSQGALRARLRRARQDGELEPDADDTAIINLIVAVMAGLAVMARSGASKVAQNGAVDQLLAGLPIRARRKS